MSGKTGQDQSLIKVIEDSLAAALSERDSSGYKYWKDKVKSRAYKTNPVEIMGYVYGAIIGLLKQNELSYSGDTVDSSVERFSLIMEKFILSPDEDKDGVIQEKFFENFDFSGNELNTIVGELYYKTKFYVRNIVQVPPIIKSDLNYYYHDKPDIHNSYDNYVYINKSKFLINSTIKLNEEENLFVSYLYDTEGELTEKKYFKLNINNNEASIVIKSYDIEENLLNESNYLLSIEGASNPEEVEGIANNIYIFSIFFSYITENLNMRKALRTKFIVDSLQTVYSEIKFLNQKHLLYAFGSMMKYLAYTFSFDRVDGMGLKYGYIQPFIRKTSMLNSRITRVDCVTSTVIGLNILGLSVRGEPNIHTHSPDWKESYSFNKVLYDKTPNRPFTYLTARTNDGGKILKDVLPNGVKNLMANKMFEIYFHDKKENVLKRFSDDPDESGNYRFVETVAYRNFDLTGVVGVKRAYNKKVFNIQKGVFGDNKMV